MLGIVDVVPCEDGWCVKVHGGGEVLRFTSGGEAERRARRLAAEAERPVEVRIHDRGGRLVGRWISEGVAA